MDIECGGFYFVSDFDSGNLARVEQVTLKEKTATSSPDTPDFEFNIWTYPDCAGTEFENGNRTWFHFGIRGGPPFALVKLNIVNLNRQSKMYSQGMAPVFRTSLNPRNQWERVRDKPTFSTDDNVFTLSFKFRTLENARAVTYFAFTYPYSYLELQNNLDAIDLKISKLSETSSKAEPKPDDIYYHRETVCHSLEGRKIDLLTISSYHGISDTREPKLPNLFPDANALRPFQFPDKKVVFLSARVHPGETPSSFVVNGVLHTLLNKDCAIGIALRRTYVFKLIPMLNPDGVARGHYRTDTRGVNLNRVYNNPSPTLHPAVYAARSLIRFYHHRAVTPDEAEFDQRFGEGKMVQISDRVSGLSLEREGMQPPPPTASFPLRPPRRHCPMTSPTTATSSRYPAISTSWKTAPLDRAVIQLRSSFFSSPEVERHRLILDDGFEKENDPVLPSECRILNTQAFYTKPADSGLFLYVDFHGHASKKGIFMYGNHFGNTHDNVDCMLLPKLMSINNQNFHFDSCNFTERNMYIRDKQGGLTREGSGRVAVLKATGLIRSYTLECNYNTGRLVNILPPPARVENLKRRNNLLLVPPKYTPVIFEEVGRALCSSILDLTGSNPHSRLANSDFRNLSGVREALKTHQLSADQGPMQRAAIKLKNTQAQVKTTQVGGGAAKEPTAMRVHRLAPLAQEAKSNRLAPLALEAKSNSAGSSSNQQRPSSSGAPVLQMRSKCSAVNALAGTSARPATFRKVKLSRDDIAVKKGTKRIKISAAPDEQKPKDWNRVLPPPPPPPADDVMLSWRSATGRRPLEKKNGADSVRRHLAPDQRRKKPKSK
ncbi:cytosolic carboxypeptidase-like protein 5 [Nilaparvata lugens]|uniref:cytosolic carboxypeptidase-like protein 5 n=1 Tax=Nilaparvata lugens TaxID=108931 RepID=UPI00193D20A3|nr:cytosolic carboxypeptidase-like protein 5 [Nilaparvata lugens]